MEKSKAKMDEYAETAADEGGQEEGKQSPFEAFGFFFYAQAGGGAGPMKEGEDRHAENRLCGPAVCLKDREDLLGGG